MDLKNIDIHGLGQFTDKPAGFRVSKYHLEEPWPYIYVTPKLLLKVDQHGLDYAQFSPPGGSILFRRERFQTCPSVLAWIRPGVDRAFSNFWRPTVGMDSSAEPDEFYCDYTPDRALYHVSQDGISCDTELFVPPDEAVVVMTCTVTNVGGSSQKLEMLPVLRPHFAAGSLAPWDVPSLYQRVGYSNRDYHLFDLQLRSPAGLPEMREYAFVMTNLESPDGVEVNHSAFVGKGTFDSPDCSTSIDAKRQFSYGTYDTANSVNGEQSIIALRKLLSLKPGESFSFTMVMGAVNPGKDGTPPEYCEVDRFSHHLRAVSREDGKAGVRQVIEGLISKRCISTPDESLNRYVNEWLPLQLRWVSLLDRGWPTGMRGVRDNSQDATALVPLYPDICRATLLNLFSVQRSDGWFPRQYCAGNRHGTHDLRDYVDSGAWVWELLYDYLCWSKDCAFLSERVPWLDSDDNSTILDHAIRLIGYYLVPENLGEHDLCLIREGDWNDSVNRAGLEGRGESVMVSCQVVMVLRQAAALVGHLAQSGLSRLDGDVSAPFPGSLIFRADELKQSILTHALNAEGYLNAVFNDDGKWIFSPSDPDGKRRVNVPVNAFGMISGVLDGDNAQGTLEILKSLKQTDGWPLFWPPIGDPPIPKLGRIGQGDLAPGLGENGTPYNHGCHGFFGRAAAVMGEGDLLHEILRYMLPYDQDAHPVYRSKTAPYGVLNHWKTAPGLEGRGGDCFLSGSISTALRNVYNGLFGIRPTLDGLMLDPALPSGWDEASVEFEYLGARVHLTYRRAKDSPRLVVDGDEVTSRGVDPVLGREALVVPDSVFVGKSRVECLYYVP